MKKKTGLSLLFSLLIGLSLSAQNFSGLLHKKLNKIDDVASVIESGLGSLFGGGKVKGSIDSVVVLNDTERELQLKIYFTGFENAILKVYASNAEKQKQDEVKKSEMPLSASRSVTCILTLNSNFTKGKLLESPFLKIEITKEVRKPGLVINYSLNKKWKVDLDAENIVFNIKPLPIGSAAALRENEVKDITPSKRIIFDATKLYYTPKIERRTEMRTMEARPVRTTLQTHISIKDYAIYQGRVAKPATDYTVKGADNKPLYLWADLKSDIEIEKPQDISNINMNIYPDKNTASGVYYFLPADYHLRYESKEKPENGYNLSILYGSTTAAEEAPVRMSAKLTAGISTREINFIKTLLKASIPSAKEVRLLPLRENPVFSFQSYLTSQYNIPQNKIAVESSTDLSNDIRVAWQTDATTKEFIQTALTSREGLAASVILKPQSETIIDQQIPVTINLAEGRTLGKITLDPSTWRTKKWQNTTPYPLQLKHLNILKLSETGRNPIIYSWSLNQTVVPSKAQVSFNPALVPSWLDRQESVLMWIDYLVADCKPCDDKVINAITGGVSGNKAQLVKFIIPPVVFDTLQATYFLINIRSSQLDPNGETIKEIPGALKITKEGDKEFTAGPMYIPTGSNLSFEYKITMATADGEFVDSKKWLPATEKEILLGKTKVKEIFSKPIE